MSEPIYAVGVDLGGTNVRAAVVEESYRQDCGNFVVCESAIARHGWCRYHRGPNCGGDSRGYCECQDRYRAHLRNWHGCTRTHNAERGSCALRAQLPQSVAKWAASQAGSRCHRTADFYRQRCKPCRTGRVPLRGRPQMPPPGHVHHRNRDWWRRYYRWQIADRLPRAGAGNLVTFL